MNLGSGYDRVCAQITSADPLTFLHRVQKAGVSLYDFQQLTPLTIQFWVRNKDRQTICTLCDQGGEALRFLEESGVRVVMRRIWGRPVLLIGCALLLILSLWLPGRVLFVQVEGNIRLPSLLIAEKAADCGISFGASRRGVRSERMKNALLEAMPQLQWAGVNTNGCVAVITVRERDDGQSNAQPLPPGSIVAIRDGVITELTVTAGTALVRPGQAVKAGQTLISGYADLGTHLRFDGAQGEVFANTMRQIRLYAQAQCQMRRDVTRIETRHSLIIGKKQINFYNNSGILDATCVKIYKENYLMLPGGFRLPVAWVTEQQIYYDVSYENWEYSKEELSLLCRQYLKQEMIAGTVVEASFTTHHTANYYRIDGIFHCHEWIGQLRTEEMDKQYGQNN